MRILALLLAAASLHAADEAPAWLQQLSKQAATLPKYDAKVKSVVLLDDSRVVVEEGGKITTTNQYAVRILTKEGRAAAIASVWYETGRSKVKELRAWMIRPNGEVKKYGKDRILDMASVDNDVYNEVREQKIVASGDVDPEAIFGYESVLEDKSVFTQFQWYFQEYSPVLLSRISISVPPGWNAKGVMYNHSQAEPAVSGNSYTWELRDLPAIKHEPSRPTYRSIAPWVAVSLVSAQGANTGLGKTFENWQDVSRWLSELNDSQMSTSPDLINKTQALTASAKSDLERITAIGRFVQDVKYVSIQTGLGRGGGYRPHAATEVFSKLYGDCKDKANLMRTMLKVAGIEAYPLSIYSGDRARVRENWASPHQFNHAIIAIRVKDDIKLPAVGSHPDLGRMLFFDPTDEHTPLGLLPENEEGSLALLVSPDRGALLRMPSSPPEANRVERRLDLTLADDGSISGTVEEKALGHPASEYRQAYQHIAKSDFRRYIEQWIGESGPGAKLDTLDFKEESENSVRLATSFQTPRYAKSMRGLLLVVRSGVLSPPGVIRLAEPTRQYPVVLNSESFEETMRMKLPNGFEVDELPAPSQLSSSFGKFSSKCEVKEGYLTCLRSMSLNVGLIPVEQYTEVRDFFRSVNGASESSVVFAKK